MNKSILIINRKQFGYHIDTYYYCKYLTDNYEVSYIGWDYNKPRIEIEGVSVKYISRKGIGVVRYLRFLWDVMLETNNKYDFYFLKYFQGCFILKLLNPHNKYIFDVRTGSVNRNKFIRNLFDQLLKFESHFFKNITVISGSLARKFKLDSNKIHILPLGADSLSENDKDFKTINLLYVGTLENRKLEDTIIGIEKFYNEYGEKILINYKIIGSGYKGEEKELKALVKSKGLEKIVEVLGHIKHDELKPYFLSQNIGVSYVPITEYFDCQPPTKTFEYGLAGMPIIATAIAEHKNVIHPFNGVLIEDNPDSFYNGLIEVNKNKERFNSEKIRKSFEQYQWGTIVNKNLKIFLQKI